MTPLLGLLDRFHSWRAAAKERDRLHAAAWARAMLVTSDGLSEFQHAARDQVGALLAARGISVAWSAASYGLRGPVRVIEGRAPDHDLELWLHDDTVSYTVGKKGDYYEYWDYLSPDALIEKLVSEVMRALEQSRAHR
jgi:hypothetical protein